MKHLEVRQKYLAARHRRISKSLLGVSSGDETLLLTLDILEKDKANLQLKTENPQYLQKSSYFCAGKVRGSDQKS